MKVSRQNIIKQFLFITPLLTSFEHTDFIRISSQFGPRVAVEALFSPAGVRDSHSVHYNVHWTVEADSLVKAASVRGERGEHSVTCDTLGPRLAVEQYFARLSFSRSYSRIFTGAGVTSSSFVLNSSTQESLYKTVYDRSAV